jgi:YHS domain-containing protein
MLLRFLFWAALLFFIGRAVFRLLGGIVDGASRPRRPPSQPPDKGEMMARDPVCGTFVVPSRAVSLRDQGGTHYFCSEACRSRFAPR